MVPGAWRTTTNWPLWAARWCSSQSRIRFHRSVGPPSRQWWTWWTSAPAGGHRAAGPLAVPVAGDDAGPERGGDDAGAAADVDRLPAAGEDRQQDAVAGQPAGGVRGWRGRSRRTGAGCPALRRRRRRQRSAARRVLAAVPRCRQVAPAAGCRGAPSGSSASWSSGTRTVMCGFSPPSTGSRAVSSTVSRRWSRASALRCPVVRSSPSTSGRDAADRAACSFSPTSGVSRPETLTMPSKPLVTASRRCSCCCCPSASVRAASWVDERVEHLGVLPRRWSPAPSR